MKFKSSKGQKFILNFIATFFLFLTVFGRPFSGLFVFNFRIGELVVVFGLMMFTYLLIFNLNIFYKKREYSILFSLQALLVILFIASMLYDTSNLINSYAYKASNYIWTLSYVYLGIFIKKYLNITNTHLLILNFFLLFSYYLNVINYPQPLVDFFFTFSDKFDFLKAHMHLLFIIVVTVLNFKFLKNKQMNSYYFLLLSGLFLPLLIFKSRGSFLSFSIFFVLYVYLNRSYLTKDIIKLIPILGLTIFLFLQSSILVSDSDATMGETDLIVTNLIDNKETRNTFLSFYISEKRLYSDDGNINWRLQIWQDVLNDSINTKNLFLGNGFTKIIPAMDIPSRGGTDGNNENVHNYFINVFARGGLAHLTIIFLIYLYFVKNILNIHQLSLVMAIILPILSVSFFDASMENPHFPAIFYLFIGFIQEKDYYNKLKYKELK